MSILGSTLCSLLALIACSPRSAPSRAQAAARAARASAAAAPAPAAAPPAQAAPNPARPSIPTASAWTARWSRATSTATREGSRLCEAAPGIDCDDGDAAFVKNECGGCNKVIGGKVGDACGTCGKLQCQGDSALQCAAPTPTTRRCSTDKQIQLCSPTGEWANEKTCSGALPACHGGACVQCVFGASKCGTAGGGAVIIRCLSTDSWEASWSTSCKPNQFCDFSSSSAKCVGMLFHPRDRDFEIPRLLREAPGSSETVTAPGLPTRDVLDMALGFAFG